MKQTFFCELEELEKQEKIEKEEKKRVELFLRKSARSRNIRDFAPVFYVLIMVLLASSMAVYALYLFINVSRIGDLANIHMTKMIGLASRSVQGKIYSNSELGISSWMVFRDRSNGLEIRYPESWKLNKNSHHLFEIKKYNSQASMDESLAAAIFLDRFENEKELVFEDLVSEKTGLKKEFFSRQSFGENSFLISGKQKNDTGFIYDTVFWERSGKIFCLKIIYYNQKNQISEEEFKKILKVMTIDK